MIPNEVRLLNVVLRCADRVGDVLSTFPRPQHQLTYRILSVTAATISIGGGVDGVNEDVVLILTVGLHPVGQRSRPVVVLPIIEPLSLITQSIGVFCHADAFLRIVLPLATETLSHVLADRLGVRRVREVDTRRVIEEIGRKVDSFIDASATASGRHRPRGRQRCNADR